MDLLSEEHLCSALSFTDYDVLLAAPVACRIFHLATLKHEAELWCRVGSQRDIVVDEDAQSATVPADEHGTAANMYCEGGLTNTIRVAQTCLGAKDEFRLQMYLDKIKLPCMGDALRHATDRNSLAIVRLLLQALADPNEAAGSGAWGVGFTQVGAFALHIAAKRNNLEAVDILLGGGAAVDAVDQNGRTGLMVAVASGRAEAAKELIACRADVDLRSHYGFGALHFAAQLPRFELVRVLLDARASPHFMDNEGQTPLHLAVNALPRQAPRQETSCDQVFGDEYIYEQDITHGYGDGGDAQKVERDMAVRRTVAALVLSGAVASARDSRGRMPRDILVAKLRDDLCGWFDTFCASIHGQSEGG